MSAINKPNEPPLELKTKKTAARRLRACRKSPFGAFCQYIDFGYERLSTFIREYGMREIGFCKIGLFQQTQLRRLSHKCQKLV